MNGGGSLAEQLTRAPRALQITIRDLIRRPAGHAALLVVAVAIPILYGGSQMQHTLARDHLDVFFECFTSPVILLLPLLAALFGASSLFSEFGNRYITNTRTRVSIRIYLAAKIAAGCIAAFLAFATIAFATFAFAFWGWPVLGDYHVDPAAYFMSPPDALADAVGRSTFSDLLAISDLAFGVFYSAWFGLCGATYALLANVLVVLLPNRAVAVGLPAALYLAVTVAASLLGSPHLGLLYSAVPFGLTQVSTVAGMSPTLVLLAATGCLFAVALIAAPRLAQMN